MKVKLRLSSGPRVRRSGTRNRHLAIGLASLLTPASLMAFAMGAWRMMADMGLSGEFVFTEGALSHWQVWVAISFLVQCGAILLNRYGRGDELEAGDD